MKKSNHSTYKKQMLVYAEQLKCGVASEDHSIAITKKRIELDKQFLKVCEQSKVLYKKQLSTALSKIKHLK
jgi:hypothetical protein